MLPKINFIFDRKHNRKVEACVYYAGKRRYLATGVTVPIKATYNNGTISGCTTAPSLNKTLTSAMNTLQEQLQQQIEEDTFDIGAFNLSLKSNKDSFYEWALQRCEESPTKQSSKGETKKILARWKAQGIESFADITAERISKAVRSFEKRLRPTTVRLYVAHLNKYIGIAHRERIIAENPMNYIKLPKGKSREINYLTHEELSLIENYGASGETKKALDMFLFACYTGLAYSDLTKIKENDIIYIKKKAHIIDKRKKTGGEYRIRILPKALDILKRYNFNLNLMKNNNANCHLAQVEKKLNLKKHLTMHVGRHTFATLALSSGVRIETVSRMLAHADIQTTQIYAKILQKDVDEGFDILEGKI